MPAINEILKPKSKEEIEDLEKRGFRKNAGKYGFCIDIKELILDYEKSEDLLKFKSGLSSILNERIKDIYIYTSKEKADVFKSIVEKLDDIKTPTLDAVDNVLISLYDWADDAFVWIESI